MVSKRQRKARKEYRESNSSGNGGDEKVARAAVSTTDKLKKNKVIRNSKGQKNAAKDGKRKSHPLRVPGKRPGEGCFICKSKDHIAKFCSRDKICLLCRSRGHALKDCPDYDTHAKEAKFCYNCGESGHRLSQCKQPMKDGGTSFAECFLCKERGHISKDCPTNTHGIYPKGGSCKHCGDVTHLAKDCPKKTSSKASAAGKVKLQISRDAAPPGGKRLLLQSGDDLEDDFEEEQ